MKPVWPLTLDQPQVMGSSRPPWDPRSHFLDSCLVCVLVGFSRSRARDGDPNACDMVRECSSGKGSEEAARGKVKAVVASAGFGLLHCCALEHREHHGVAPS